MPIAPFPKRAEKPQLIFLDRPSQRDAGIIDFENLAHRRETARAQVVVQVAGFQTVVGVQTLEAEPEGVASLLGNHVQYGSVGRALGRDAAGLQRRFLHHQRVGDVADVPARVIDRHAVELSLAARFAVVRETEILVQLAGDVRHTSEAGCDLHERPPMPGAAGQHIQQIARDDGLLANVLRVHERRRAGDGDRLLERSDLQVGVDVCRESRCQHDAFALQGVEAAQRERDDVGAGQQVDDVVPALSVADDTADLFNQGRTGGFNRHARQHRTGRVFHHARDATGLLGSCGRRKHQHPRKGHEAQARELPSHHDRSPSCHLVGEIERPEKLSPARTPM